MTVNPLLYRNLPFDIARDFAPVTEPVAVHFVLVVHPSLPVRTVKDLIALAKARPGQINFSSSGAGGASHLAGELFNNLAKTNLVHIPYKGRLCQQTVRSGRGAPCRATGTIRFPAPHGRDQ